MFSNTIKFGTFVVMKELNVMSHVNAICMCSMWNIWMSKTEVIVLCIYVHLDYYGTGYWEDKGIL